MTAPTEIKWTNEDGTSAVAWISPSGAAAPKRIVTADDRMSADTAYRLTCEGTAIFWQGDYHNGRGLVDALGRRLQKRRRKLGDEVSLIDRFNLHRQAQSHRARIMNAVLVPVDGARQVALRRAPDTRGALAEVLSPAQAVPAMMSLRAVQGILSAAEWQRKGVPIPALDIVIHPRFGVYSPVRGEYVDLVVGAPLPKGDIAFDLGTGTGVLAIALAKRGMRRVIATEIDPRAVECARENIARIAPKSQIEVIEGGLYPEGRAALIVCNPPWLPGRPTTPVEGALYDPDSQMLHAFLNGLPDHLEPGGEGWLILSDLAEHLGLRAPGAVSAAIDAAGLSIVDRIDIRPRHGKASDVEDPLAFARSQEVTSLWRLTTKRSVN